MPQLTTRLDWVHVHLMINHVPVILAMAGTLAVLLALGRPRRGIWLYAVVSLTLAAVAVVPTYLTGEPADHALGDPWYVAEASIHAHEEAAKVAAIIVLVAGVVSALAWRRLVRYPREVRMPVTLRTAVVVTALAASGALGYAALLGGRIVHDAPALRGADPRRQPPAALPSTPSPVVPTASTSLPPSSAADSARRADSAAAAATPPARR